MSVREAMVVEGTTPEVAMLAKEATLEVESIEVLEKVPKSPRTPRPRPTLTEEDQK